MIASRRLALSIATSILLCARVSSAQAPLGAVVWDTFTGTNGTQLIAHALDVAPAGAGWTHREGGAETLQGNRVATGSTSGFTLATIATGLADGSTGVDLVSSTADVY